MARTGAQILHETFARIHARRRTAALLTATFAACAIALGAFCAALAAETMGAFPPSGRVALWIGIFCASAAGTVFSIHRVRTAIGTQETIARDIERRFPEFRERLIAGWEFATRPISGSRSLADAVVDDAANVLQRLDVRPLVSWRETVRGAVVLSAAVAAVAALWFAFPDSIPPGFARMLAPTETFRASAPFAFTVEPGNTRLLRGDTLSVRAVFTGSYPRRVAVLTRDLEAQVWRSDVVTVADSAVLVWQTAQLRSDLEYRIVAGEIESPLYRVTVVEPPSVERFRIVLNYPAYTNLKPDTLAENEGNITALLGTSASFTLHPTKPVTEAALRFQGADTGAVALRRDGDALSAKWIIRRAGEYSIRLVDEYGYADRNPISYRVSVLADEFPSVRIAEPTQEADLGADMAVPLLIEARDDFGFDRLELQFRGPDGITKTTRLPLTSYERGRAESQYVWDVGGFDLLPEDRLYYRAVIYDNDRVSGPKRAESEEKVLRFPSAAEVFAEAQQQQQRSIVDLRDVTRQGAEVQRQLDALRRELLKTQNLSWESRQATQRAIEQQREMNQNLQQIADSLRTSLERLQRHDVLAPETMDKLMQIQEMMSSIITPELRESLAQLQASAQQMPNPQQVQQALERLSQNRQQFDQRLDRVLKLLQEAQAEQQLEAMSKRLQELARLQRDVVESFDRQLQQTLANREQILGGQVAETQSRLERMAEEMRGVRSSPSDSLRAIAEQIQRNRLPERLQQVGNRLAQGAEQTRRQDRAEAQNIADQLDQAAGSMQRTAEARRNRQKQDIARKLDRAATDLLRLSMMQEDLRNRTAAQSRSRSGNATGEEQVDLLQGTSGVIQRIMEASQETFLIPPEALQELGVAVIEMRGATEALEQKNVSSATPRQQSAMASLNRAVDQIRSSRDAAQSGESGTGLEQLLQQLSQAANRQRHLNAAMQALGQQPSLSPSDLQMLGQMGSEQRALSQLMQQLSQELMRHKEILGRLGDLAGEMETAADEMERRQLGPRLADRQQRILQRLLDAQRSLQQDKMSDQRIARSAAPYSRQAPGELPRDLGERRTLLREALLDALRADFPPEYRTWIRWYYEQLMSQNSQTEKAPPVRSAR
jgi:hypothetical protein